MRRAILRATLAAAMALTLASCDSRPRAADGYTFEKKEYVNATPIISIVTHDSQADLLAAAPPATRREAQAANREIQAWSLITSNNCEIHIVDPEVKYDPIWIGHELTHCVYGRWHS